MRGLGIGILVIFYGIYLGKMVFQRTRGIRTDHLAKGEEERAERKAWREESGLRAGKGRGDEERDERERGEEGEK